MRIDYRGDGECPPAMVLFNGVEAHDVFLADTETGEIQQYARNSEGHYFLNDTLSAPVTLPPRFGEVEIVFLVDVDLWRKDLRARRDAVNRMLGWNT